MGHLSDNDDRAYQAFNARMLNPETGSTSLGSTALLLLAGAYAVFKALELLGFPVWLWIHMAVDWMGTLRLPGVGSASELPADEDSPDSAMQRGGGLLSSVFGLSSSNLLQKGVRGVTGALSKSASASEVPPGLGNWDNSCYQNSVIQGLAALPSLRDHLSETTSAFPTLNITTTNGALFDMISKLNDPENHGQNFWIRGKLKSMNTFQQQDAQEYYSKILEALDLETKRASGSRRRSSASWVDAAKSLSLPRATTDSRKTSKIVEKDEGGQKSDEQPEMPLDGLLAQRVGCVNCGYSEGLQLIPFTCLTVSLGKNSTYDVRDCLDEYTTLEPIEGVECAKCTLLRQKRTLSSLVASGAPFGDQLTAVEEALENDDFDDKTLVKKFNIAKKNWSQSTKTKQAVIARAPKALVMHVNRSIFDEMTGAQYKNNAAVTYPRLLDLSEWCLGSRPSESKDPDVAVEEWPRDPTKSLLGDTAESASTSPFQYQLRAAVTHYGTHGNGHYVCYRPHARKPSPASHDDFADEEKSGERWWRFSDDSVYAISEEQAHQGNVFMLFYERVDEPRTTSRVEQQAVVASHAVDEALQRPPTAVPSLQSEVIDDTATSVPVPDDEEQPLSELVASPNPLATVEERPDSPFSPGPREEKNIDTTAYPTPPPDTPPTLSREDTEPSEADSEDAPSTLLTSDDELPPTALANPKPKTAPSPHMMRTAGNSAGRGGGGGRRSLPMVTAT